MMLQRLDFLIRGCAIRIEDFKQVFLFAVGIQHLILREEPSLQVVGHQPALLLQRLYVLLHREERRFLFFDNSLFALLDAV